MKIIEVDNGTSKKKRIACMSEQWEEPCVCDCGEVFELQDGVGCDKCNKVYCENCVNSRNICEYCDE